MNKMERRKDYKVSKRRVEVADLSFLCDRNHRYGWLRRHYKHHRLRLALKKSEEIIAADQKVATDLSRYYFIPKSRIHIQESGR